MSIPGKILIAVLSAALISIVFGALLNLGSFQVFMAATTSAAVLAVLASHRAIPMPQGLNGGAKAATEASRTGSAAASAGADTETGKVKWFNSSKGFGFIIRDNGEEIFVHHRSIRGEGRRSLKDGATVRYRVVTTEKGPQAEDVESIG